MAQYKDGTYIVKDGELFEVQIDISRMMGAEVIHPALIDFKKKTNADRIRMMSDEELAEWYWWMLKYVQGYTDSRCALLDWLRKEADTCNNSEETCAAKLE